MELLIENGTVVTMNAARDVVRADVLIDGGRIRRIGPNLSRAGRPRKVIDATDRIVMPGLVQAHIHLCQALFRNRADGLELLDWLRTRIWPFEAAHDPASVRASAELGIAELLKGGTTALQDMGTVHHTEVVFEAAKAAGIRLVGGKAMMDAGDGVPKGLVESTRQSVDDSMALAKRYRKKSGSRLSYAFAPRFVLSCTEDLLVEVSKQARALGARVHTHASENQRECQVVRERVEADNVEYFESIGLLGSDVSLAHCVFLSEKERRLLAESGTHVVHCPSTNLKLASGIAPIPELLGAGVSVALGADGAPCNNNLDGFLEMRLAALVHAPRVGPKGMPPGSVLELATMGGARALGLAEEIGSLEVGKRGDVIVLNLNGLHAVPAGEDPMARIVYCARATDVETVVIDGQVVVQAGELLTMDHERIRASAKEEATRLLARAQAA